MHAKHILFWNMAVLLSRLRLALKIHVLWQLNCTLSLSPSGLKLFFSIRLCDHMLLIRDTWSSEIVYMQYQCEDAKIKRKVEFIIAYCICTSRRAHLKECFDVLKKEVPSIEDKKTSNLNILRSALKHIQVRETFNWRSVVQDFGGVGNKGYVR